MLRLHLVAIVALLAGLPACATTEHRTTSAEADVVVAVVNRDAITLAELQEDVATRRAEARERGPEHPDDALTQASLSQLIEFRLLVQEADRQNITVDDVELAREMNGRLKRYGVKSQEEFEGIIRTQGLTPDSITKRLRESLRVQKLLRRNIALGVSVTDDEVTRYLDESRDKLEIGLNYRARQIVLVPDGNTEVAWEVARVRASSIHHELALGDDFGGLARRHSQDVTGPDGGDLGPLKRGELPADIETQILRLAPGEVSLPFRSSRAYYIFRLDTRETLTDESIRRLRPELRELIFRQKYDDRFEAWLRPIKQRAVVEVRGLPEKIAASSTTDQPIRADVDRTYFEAMRARIRQFWGAPCVEDPATRTCEYVAAQATIEMRLHPDGRLASVAVARSSGVSLYDEYAMDAVKLASPFNAVPKSIGADDRRLRFTVSFTYGAARQVVPAAR